MAYSDLYTNQVRIKAPWPGGVTYRCNQGNFGPYSHNTPYTFYSWDFNLPMDSPVLAVTDGVICLAGCTENDGYGNQLRIKHHNGAYSIYAHLNDFCVFVGQSVQQGQLIAYSGSTGNVTGPHLHFSIIDTIGFSLPSIFCDIGIPMERFYYTSQNWYRQFM